MESTKRVSNSQPTITQLNYPMVDPHGLNVLNRSKDEGEKCVIDGEVVPPTECDTKNRDFK
jgi:hypothetical protein